MGEVRRRFHEELRALESEVQRIGVQARLLMEKALQALTHRDVAVCDAVISGDDEVDQLYLDAERRILHLFALQTPVASDLRLLTALLHINLHLERIADQAVNLAKITKLVDGLPQSPTALQHLGVGWQTVGSRPDRPDIRPCKRWVEPQFATVEGASGVASRRVVQVAGHDGVGDQI